MNIIIDLVIGIVFVLAPALMAFVCLYSFLFDGLEFWLLIAALMSGFVALFGLCALFPERVAQPVSKFIKNLTAKCSETLSPLWERIGAPAKKIVNIAFLILGGAIVLMYFVYPAYVVTLQPLVIWLEHGVWPERDLYWAISNIDCVRANWEQMEFNSFDYCRLSSVEWSDWVGLNRIVNWLMEVHVLIATVIISWVYYLIVRV